MRRPLVFGVVAVLTASLASCSMPFGGGSDSQAAPAKPTRTSTPAEIQEYCNGLDGVAQEAAQSIITSALGSALTGKKPTKQQLADKFLGSVLDKMRQDAPSQIAGDMDKVVNDYHTKVKGTPIEDLERRMKDSNDEVFGQEHWRNVQDFLKKECKNDPLSSAKDSMPSV